VLKVMRDLEAGQACLGTLGSGSRIGLHAYPQGNAADPEGAAAGQLRALRGGAWLNNPRVERASPSGGNVPAHAAPARVSGVPARNARLADATRCGQSGC
jgi:hypothetical protein